MDKGRSLYIETAIVRSITRGGGGRNFKLRVMVKRWSHLTKSHSAITTDYIVIRLRQILDV